MWDASVESLKRLDEGDKGGGCILAHCMGLGKTFQVSAILASFSAKRVLFQNSGSPNTQLRLLYSCNFWLAKAKNYTIF